MGHHDVGDGAGVNQSLMSAKTLEMNPSSQSSLMDLP
jgi:hypothetical protein